MSLVPSRVEPDEHQDEHQGHQIQPPSRPPEIAGQGGPAAECMRWRHPLSHAHRPAAVPGGLDVGRDRQVASRTRSPIVCEPSDRDLEMIP